MLFSSADIAGYVNAGFEPVWVSVRPVPMVTIDFGNGVKITRTLSGNVATSVCDADGRVLDVLPGIYTPDEYRKQLDQFRLLYTYVGRASGAKSEGMVKAYHTRQAERLKAEQPADVLVLDIHAFVSKVKIENPVKLLAAAEAVKVATATQQVATAPTGAGAGVAGWKELAEDTRINETLRRRQIHEKLADVGPVPPKDLVKWLYKDVLHADLDDPMLGLGEVLNRNYPFADEERKTAAP